MTPDFLTPGDKIGIVAFAKKITIEEIQPAVKIFQNWGLDVVIGNTIGSELNQFSGDDEQRRADIQKMLDNQEIKAIISARGGYGCVRIIDEINFSSFLKSPKWLIGFSDITVFHSHINANFNIPTIHATMPVFFKKNTPKSLSSLKKLLMKGTLNYQIQSKTKELCKNGKARGQLIGGNLSILYSLCGSISSVKTDGKILFIEDLSEYMYHVDRMIYNLKRNGYFKNLSGLIIGSFTEMKDSNTPFGKNSEEIIFDLCKDLNIPIFSNFPAGHINDNRALIFGKTLEMQVEEGNLCLEWIRA
ncbi:MAG: LD-carboxypeptidase [Flavobacteriales bacterium]|nr:LD-carboxypeptidase [Flavobacteriales bacterium]|tara:strand:+ start:1227 stop:2135 length:909 start_codon:yes stop_codon:yes gene_type:complete